MIPPTLDEDGEWNRYRREQEKDYGRRLGSDRDQVGQAELDRQEMERRQKERWFRERERETHYNE